MLDIETRKIICYPSNKNKALISLCDSAVDFRICNKHFFTMRSFCFQYNAILMTLTSILFCYFFTRTNTWSCD